MAQKTIQQLGAQTSVVGTDLLVIQRGSSPLAKITAQILAQFVASLVNVAQALGYTPANKAGDNFTGKVTVRYDADSPLWATNSSGLYGHEFGNAANQAFHDFHTSNTALDYDARILVSGPPAPTTFGQGTMAFMAAVITFSSRPAFNGATPWDSTNLNSTNAIAALGLGSAASQPSGAFQAAGSYQPAGSYQSTILYGTGAAPALQPGQVYLQVAAT